MCAEYELPTSVYEVFYRHHGYVNFCKYNETISPHTILIQPLNYASMYCSINAHSVCSVTRLLTSILSMKFNFRGQGMEITITSVTQFSIDNVSMNSNLPSCNCPYAHSCEQNAVKKSSIKLLPRYSQVIAQLPLLHNIRTSYTVIMTV